MAESKSESGDPKSGPRNALKEELKANGNNIKVIARFRPANALEIESGGVDIVQYLDETTCRIVDKEGNSAGPFTFDRVFGSDSKQSEVFEYSLRQTVQDVMKGYNGTVLAYGQTGSGKSYTMTGSSLDASDEQRGAIPRIVDQLFEMINDSPADIEYMVKVSYMEIYMERIKDLLDPTNSNLSIHEEKSRGVHVRGLSEVYVSSAQDVVAIMAQGSVKRAVASTNMNQESSRSHSIFTIVVSQKSISSGAQKSGQLFLVDLAGSEKVGKTGASGQTLEEAKKINKSLSALGMVINSLTDGRSAHVPYRDSKLTRILQESLGGNSRTSLIVTCSPSSFNTPETISTLRFGVRAKDIKNKAKINTELSPAELRMLIKKFQGELAVKSSLVSRLETELALWRSGATVPSSDWVGGGGGVSGGSGGSGVDSDYLEQLAEKDAIIEQQEVAIRELRDQNTVDDEYKKLVYENKELNIKLTALEDENKELTSRIKSLSEELVTAASVVASGGVNKETEQDGVRDGQGDLLDGQGGVLDGDIGEAIKFIESQEYNRAKEVLRKARISSTETDALKTRLQMNDETIMRLVTEIDRLTKEKKQLELNVTDKPETVGLGSPDGIDPLKRSLMKDLQDRCERIVELEILLDQARDQYNLAIKNGTNQEQRRKLALLQRNLDQLTAVQRQLIESNRALRNETERSRALLESRNARIQDLETQLALANQKLALEQENHAPRSVRSVSSKIVKPLRGGGSSSGSSSAEATPQKGLWEKLNTYVPR